MMGVDAIIRVRSKLLFKSKELSQLGYELREAVGHDNFYTPGDEYLDGETITLLDEKEADPIPGWPHQYEVNYLGRYYGEGYERGSWPTIYAVLTWAATRMSHYGLSPVEMVYDGDSGDMDRVFDANRALELWAHWCRVGGRPYFQRPSWRHTKPVICCGNPCGNYGGGSAREFWYCAGCGKHYISEGETVTQVKDFNS